MGNSKRDETCSCPKCGGELLYVKVPNGGNMLWCSWCERAYYDPRLDKDGLRREFMRQFGDEDVLE